MQQSRIAKTGSESLVKSGEYANLVEVVYASFILHIAIEVFYPSSFNLFTKQDQYSGAVRCTIRWSGEVPTRILSNILRPENGGLNNVMLCLKTDVGLLVGVI